MREFLSRLFRPKYLRKIVQIRECVGTARESLDGMIASFPDEDRWLILKEIDKRTDGLTGKRNRNSSPCTDTHQNHQNA